MTEKSRVGLITRLSTQNAGNEALSIELIKFAKEMLPDSHIMALDRYPRYFNHLNASSLESHGRDPLVEFDKLADRLTERFFRTDAPMPEAASERSVRLDLTAKELGGPLRMIKRAIGFRKNLARLGVIGIEEAVKTISACGRADLIIWNPAGEFHPTGGRDEPFRLLLLLRIAQKKNVRTAIINHSLEITDPLLLKLVGHVYRHADYVCVRDANSVEVALAMQVDPGKVIEAPDLVFLASREAEALSISAEKLPAGAIGMAINGLEAMRGTDEWHSLMAQLTKLDRPVVFVSNAMNHDLSFGSKLMALCGGKVLERQPSYRELRNLYSRMDVVISSRLHSSILSLCEGTPVVSVEPSVFKLSAIFRQLQYPIPTDSLNNPGWSERIADHVIQALSSKSQLTMFAKEALERQVTRIVKSYKPIFDLAKAKHIDGIGHGFRAARHSGHASAESAT